MSLYSTLRNIVIVLAIAAVIAIVPAGGWAAAFVIQFVSLAFLASIAWVASRLYREHRVTLYGLGDRQRAILYVAIGIAVLTLSAYNRLTRSGGGTVAFLLLLGACAVAIFRIFQSSRSY